MGMATASIRVTHHGTGTKIARHTNRRVGMDALRPLDASPISRQHATSAPMDVRCDDRPHRLDFQRCKEYATARLYVLVPRKCLVYATG